MNPSNQTNFLHAPERLFARCGQKLFKEKSEWGTQGTPRHVRCAVLVLLGVFAGLCTSGEAANLRLMNSYPYNSALLWHVVIADDDNGGPTIEYFLSQGMVVDVLLNSSHYVVSENVVGAGGYDLNFDFVSHVDGFAGAYPGGVFSGTDDLVAAKGLGDADVEALTAGLSMGLVLGFGFLIFWVVRRMRGGINHNEP